MSSDKTTIDAEAGGSGSDSLTSFVADLRQLVDAHPGGLTLGALAQLADMPKSTLSAVLNGKKLPSERTLTAIVAALGGDSQAWLQRRKQLQLTSLGIPLETVLSHDADAQVADGDDQATKKAWLRPRWLLVLLLAAALLVGGGIGAGITWKLAAPKNPWDPGIVQTGENPAFYPICMADAKVSAAETRLDNYLLEIIWSTNCRAGWGRVTRYDDKSQGNRVIVTTFLQADPDGPSTQYADDPDTQSSYTYLIASHSIDDRICVKGSVTDGDKTIDLGAPLCL